MMKVSFEVYTKKGRVTIERTGATYAECLKQAKAVSGFVRIGQSRVVDKPAEKV